jgi:hypothetical protein
MRIEPIKKSDGTQYLTSTEDFYAVGWIEGSDQVFKMTSQDEFITAPNKVSNAQVFQGNTIKGFGWKVTDGWDEFINEIENVEGLTILIEKLQ